jgi:hypothetical protein
LNRPHSGNVAYVPMQGTSYRKPEANASENFYPSGFAVQFAYILED